MDNSLTVRLFVRTQTYDISCDPRQPAKWLLMQAKNIQRSSQKQTSQEEELEVLYNRTTRRVINLEDSIGSSISSMDVVDARTLLQTPDTSCNSAMFPWLRSYAGGLLSSDKIDSSNGLFFQQLYAFTLIGKRTPVSASQRKQKEDQDNFLSLLHTYVMGSYDRDYIPQPQPTGTRRLTAPSSPMYRPHYDPNGFSDSGSDSSVEESPSYPTYFSANDYTKPQRTLISPSPVNQVPMAPSPSAHRSQNALDEMDNVFDIVFKQQAIGMKLGADETKQFAIVKECFEGSEAKRYPEIQNGVVILAVNGQEVSGLGLSRVLYRLREAPRPVVVRFGRKLTPQLLERRNARIHVSDMAFTTLTRKRPSDVQDAAVEEEVFIRQLLRDLKVDTGDVILFNRSCVSMGPYGGAICVCAKFFGQTQWDHNGVVVRAPWLAPDAKSPEDELFLLEAALTGVKLRPLVARVVLSRGYDVAVRKLQIVRTPELQKKAEQYALGSLDALYEDDPTRFFNAGLAVPTRIARERIFAALVATKKERARLDAELAHRDKMPVFERKALQQELQTVNERYQALASELGGRTRSVFENAVVEGDDVKSTKMFCSQLVAGMYQYLGLLLPYPSAKSYLPKHFSERDGGNFLKLQQGASFLPEVSLRKELVKETKRVAMRILEANERGPRTGTETAAIVHCLRRHHLFHTLSEPELLSAALHFRRRVLTKGEVVFFQGAPGDCFNIIERGNCDVFVDYDHLSETKTALEADEGSKPEFKRRTQLQKRKTIALPEFQSSSKLVGHNEHVLVATHGPGNAFGDSALVYDTPRRATIQANAFTSGDSNEAVVLWQLDKQKFREILACHPSSQQSMEERRFLLKALKDHPLFTELDDRAKAHAVRKFFPLKVRAGTTILRQGDPGDYFYVVESGRCEVTRCKPKATKPFVDRVIGRGASFGEASLLYNSRRGASVKALDDAKVWCMDRVSFHTITRSGSTALYRLFKRVGQTVVSGSSESFATERDLRRMLRNPQHLQSDIHSANDNNEIPGNAAVLLPSAQAYDRAIRVALSLLLNDPSGLVNFSQFAHFHIALGASNLDHFLPEAAFRVLKSVTSFNDETKSHVPVSSDLPVEQDYNDQAAIRLNDLPRAIRQYVSTSEAVGSTFKTIETSISMTPERLAFYERMFDLPKHQFGDQYVTHDDLVRGIAAFEMEDASSENGQEDQVDVSVAKDEFRAFLTALKFDINVLRTVWHAAEMQANDKDQIARVIDQNRSTFISNVKSGWLSSLHQNPTGDDWEYLQPELERSRSNVDYQNNAEILGQQMTAQLTSFAAAIAAGVVVRTICAPLERLRILMQLTTPKLTSTSATVKLPSATPPYTSVTKGIVNMMTLSGPRSLFSGNVAHCLWVVPCVPIKFALGHVYHEHLMRSAFQSSSLFGDKSRVSASLTTFVMGGFAGLTLNCLLYPLDVIRGRLTAQEYYNANRPYTGILHCARSIRDHEGLRGFYRGFGPASLGVFTYIGCNYALYESLRPVFVHYDVEDTSIQLASLVSQCISYPFDVIRRRIQLQGTKWHPELAFSSYKGAWHCVRASVVDEGGALRGMRSLYRGFVINVVKALPSTVISFLSYEKLRTVDSNCK
ncbi:putative mitochondrial carrier domain protein [Plasmopara halstedii]